LFQALTAAVTVAENFSAFSALTALSDLQSIVLDSVFLLQLPHKTAGMRGCCAGTAAAPSEQSLRAGQSLPQQDLLRNRNRGSSAGLA
jgi:hypothetical protein